MKTRLPVIVSFGGFGPAGRSSNHNAYKRLVLDSLTTEQQQETILGLAVIMRLVTFKDGSYFDKQAKMLSQSEIAIRFKEDILQSTLIRKIEKSHFDPEAVTRYTSVELSADTNALAFEIHKRQLPDPLPTGWKLGKERKDAFVNITLSSRAEFKVKTTRTIPASSAGMLPTGFDPTSYYASNAHPRGLSMALMGASDALRSMGISWEKVMQHVNPDEVSVYSGSAMGQLDQNGGSGYITSSQMGGRVSAKQLPLSLNTMPADFINAYLLGSVGTSGSVTGACATFLYNLKAATHDITSGRSRVVLVGNSEAPITPEVIDGYHAMSALASDEKLLSLDQSDQVDHRRASRPFGENCGFTLAESSQYFVIMDDQLAMDLGANIYGAVTDVFVNADGFKKSISAPGPGNLITMTKALASAKALLGGEAIIHNSFVQAHGSSTPQNRVSEASLLQRVAAEFKIQKWPTLAVKSYVGHSLSPSSADQLMSTLGVFEHNILPGIKTVSSIAEDVQADRLHFPLQDEVIKQNTMKVGFLNSKGFGGNNASACIISPKVVEAMIIRRYGNECFSDYQEKLKTTKANISRYEKQALQGDISPDYKFGLGIIDEANISIDNNKMNLPSFSTSIGLAKTSIYGDMVE
jgi:acetoacetyl-[acyl-carrier protein] synthase